MGVGTDVLQLTTTCGSLNLGQFNHFGQQVIFNFEKIDLATDTGANSVTLTAADLFLMYSEKTDASTGAMTMLTIDGNALDTVNCGLNTAAGFTQVAGAFDATGAAGVGYSKYTGQLHRFR